MSEPSPSPSGLSQSGPSQHGLKFGAAAPDYERGRPDWPVQVVDLAASRLDLTPAATVVDLAAGTGKLTRQLARRFDRVVAVEPLAPMRQLIPADPRVEVRAGTAERLPVPDGSVQAVFVADAFHWFDAAAALAETARVLAPGGGIAVLWHHPSGRWEPPLPEPARELARSALARGGEAGSPRIARGLWREAFAGSAFGPLGREQFEQEHSQDRDGLVAYFLSISSIAGLPDSERADLRARLCDLLRPGTYRQRLRTELYWARLQPVRWCPRCGDPLHEPAHAGCAAARELEPPRYCRHCRRRMRVQVLPAGWRALCSAHGEVRAR